MVGNGISPATHSASPAGVRGEAWSALAEPERKIDLEGLRARFDALPAMPRARAAAERTAAEAYLVGGSVRDSLLGRTPAELDLVVVGDPAPLVEALGGEAKLFERFSTATVVTAEGRVDVAVARTESYAAPGALPDVSPAADVVEDLARRDFTINAIAVPLAGEPVPIDPYGGVADLGAGTLRLLHEGSVGDDPTRALRAARYGGRLGFAVEPRSLGWIRAADFAGVSADRVDAELRRIAAEAEPWRPVELLAAWGLLGIGAGAARRVEDVCGVVAAEPWRSFAEREEAVLTALADPSARIEALVAEPAPAPSHGRRLAGACTPAELALARALGAAWLDEFAGRWRHVGLEVSGDDLIAAGVPEGPAVGLGLAAALDAKLDGRVAGREAELALALEVARAA